MSEQKYTISEGFELPSKGLIYGKDKNVNPLVELRSMTTREEMKRLSPSNTPYKTLCDIIDACLITKLPIKSYDMCMGDFEYLLHKLRVVTHGAAYKMLVTCPVCGKAQELTINLDEEESIEYDESLVTDLLELELPRSDKRVTLKFQTPRILDTVSLKASEMQKKVKDSNINFDELLRLVYAIDTVDGNKISITDAETFINNLPASDTNKIRNAIEKLNRAVGLKNKFDMTCEKCGFEVDVPFRFQPEFFRPSEE